ncbi:MAG: PQQ-binding-like beta-propeller repeat protein [Nitrososphaerota archaeon]
MSTAMQHEWLRRLSDYHSGDVDEAEMVAVEQHLAHCLECQQALALYRRFYALAHAPTRLGAPSRAVAERLVRFEPSPDIFADDTDDVDDVDDAEESPQSPRHPRRSRSGRMRPRQNQNRLKVTLAAVLAASLIIAGFLALLGPRIPGRPQHPGPTPSGPSTVPTPTLHLDGLSVYVADRLAWYAFNADNGTPRWTTRSQFFEGDSPVLVDGVVYSAVSGQSCWVQAVKASDGSLLWQHQLALMDSPHLIVAGDSIYVVSDRLGIASNSNNHGIYALRTSDGSLLWQHPTPDPVVADPIVANGVVYASSGTSLLALRASDGTLLWNLPLAANGHPDIGLWLASANGVVYVIAGEKGQDFPFSDSGENNTLLALRPGDGSQLWRIALGSDYYSQPSTPVIANGVIYVRAGASREDKARGDTTAAHLYALRASDGSQLWQYQQDRTKVTWNSGQSTTSATMNPQIFQPVYAEGWVYTYDRFGDVIALRASDGALLWKQRISRPDGIAGLSVAGGALFVSVNGDLIPGVTSALPEAPDLLLALRAGDGATLWQRIVGESIGGMNAPVVAP